MNPGQAGGPAEQRPAFELPRFPGLPDKPVTQQEQCAAQIRWDAALAMRIRRQDETLIHVTL